jgi:carbohydrate diacid regulator
MDRTKRLETALRDLEEAGRIGSAEVEYLLEAMQQEDSIEQFFEELLHGRISVNENDLIRRAKKLNLDLEAKWIVYHIQTAYPAEARELLGQMYSDPQEAVFLDGSPEMLRLLLMAAEKDVEQQAKEAAEQIVSMINTELMEKVYVGYSDVCETITLQDADAKAGMALEILRTFYEERLEAGYGSLGIGRLIYSIQKEDCEAFLEEYFGEEHELELSEEELQTVNKFFEKNLNISETARDLFMHRNTLVYHLEKLQKKTGLDIRRFDDAITLKIALMVERLIEK